MTKRNPEFDGFSAYFAVRAETMAYYMPLMGTAFQPTPPARTETLLRYHNPLKFSISTHSAHEDGDGIHIDVAGSAIGISTHSAHEDGDQAQKCLAHIILISTHSAREDGDNSAIALDISVIIFQPTPPARTETWPLSGPGALQSQFQPTPPARTETAYPPT